MESIEASYILSPESPGKMSSPLPKSPASDSMEKATYVRFLVSNTAAGSVIGKSGATITEFQQQSGARIQLSRNYELFPGTSDRIVLISGRIDDVLRAVELVLSKLYSELRNPQDDDDGPRMRVRLVVPNASCGSIIGKGGAIIRSFAEESQANIKVSPQDNNFYGLNDRLVTVSGTLEKQMRAIDLILSKLIEDPHYSQNMQSPFSYAAVFNLVNQYGSYRTGGRFQNYKENYSNSSTIAVADEWIGLVVGRGGRNVMEISQISGARIKISDRGDFIPGTKDRKITISGSQRAIQVAEGLIREKVSYASEIGTY